MVASLRLNGFAIVKDVLLPKVFLRGIRIPHQIRGGQEFQMTALTARKDRGLNVILENLEFKTIHVIHKPVSPRQDLRLLTSPSIYAPSGANSQFLGPLLSRWLALHGIIGGSILIPTETGDVG